MEEKYGEYMKTFFKNIWKKENKNEYRFFGVPVWRHYSSFELEQWAGKIEGDKCNYCGEPPKYREIKDGDNIFYIVYCNNCGHGAVDLCEPHIAFKNFSELEKKGSLKLAEIIIEYATFPFRGN